jgi:hypothetical protein
MNNKKLNLKLLECIGKWFITLNGASTTLLVVGICVSLYIPNTAVVLFLLVGAGSGFSFIWGLSLVLVGDQEAFGRVAEKIFGISLMLISVATTYFVGSTNSCQI